MVERELDPLLASVVAELRRPVEVDPRLDERVMAAITAPKVIPLQPRRRPWLLRPVTLSLPRLAVLAAAAAVVFVGIRVWRGGVGGGSGRAVIDVVQASAGAPTALVSHQFIFAGAGARSVRLVGDFNDWDPEGTPMEMISPDGLWSVTLPLAPGTYRYQFVVDDTLRVLDPTVPALSSEFGSPNSVVTIVPAGRR
ncbi:MAG TPA: isoamylase early set domain-containing protein [Gemmatimonadaceae bacterium]|nr:isoamylase early set domain-containing protein [Gemmatimonadaceae bacterium]